MGKSTVTKQIEVNKIRMSKRKIWTSLALGSLLMAIATNFFIAPIQLYSPGLSGIAYGLVNTLQDVGVSFIPVPDAGGTNLTAYWIIYAIMNVPIIIFTLQQFNKKFFIYSLGVFFFTLAFSQIMTQVPAINNVEVFNVTDADPDLKNVMMIEMSLIGGVIYGVGMGTAFKVGACSMGLDPVAKYIAREKNRSIAPILFAFAITNAIFWTVVRSFTISGMTTDSLTSFLQNTFFSISLISTFIFIGTLTLITGLIYKTGKKLVISVNTSKAEEISKKFIDENYHRSHTISTVVGGFSKKEFKKVEFIVNIEEMNDVVEMVAEVDCQALITISSIYKIFDTHDWRPEVKGDDDKFIKSKPKQTTTKKVEEVKEVKKAEPVKKPVAKATPAKKPATTTKPKTTTKK